MEKSILNKIIKDLKDSPSLRKIEKEFSRIKVDDKIYVANMVLSEIATKMIEKETKYSPKIIQKLRDVINDSNKELKEIATKDPLTKLHNRSQLSETFEVEQHRMRRDPKYIFSILLLDIDYFKKFNDEYGHNAGDEVLKTFSKVITENIRGTDGAFRYGGEEFVIIYSGTSASEAYRAAKHLGSFMEEFEMGFIDKKGKSHKKNITFSGGVTQVKKDEPLKEAIERADKLLYQVKQKGRNDVMYKK